MSSLTIQNLQSLIAQGSDGGAIKIFFNHKYSVFLIYLLYKKNNTTAIS